MTTAQAPRVSSKKKPAPSREKATFLRAFLKKPSSIGAIMPSGKLLCRKMVDSADLKNAKHVLEFGPGTGVVTDELLPRLPAGCRYMAIELNESLAEIFRGRHPGALLKHDNVLNVKKLCEEEGFGPIDVIISGLPWTTFSSKLQDGILSAALSVLKPGGELVTFGYQIGTWTPQGRRFYKKLPQRFSKVVRSRYVWRNFPPAMVVRMVK